MNEISIENWQLNIVQEKKLEKMDLNVGHSWYYALKNLMEPPKISLLGGES